MSQPFDRGAQCPPPAEMDDDLGEFWSGSAWKISDKNNLSGYERNRTYLNVGGRNFLDISHLTGADSDGDGRCVVPADLNHDGRQELIVRQVGGGSLRVFENQFPQRSWLRVSLSGTKSNRLGIGARLVAHIGNRRIVRELYPVNSYRSQAPAAVHFGLSDAGKVDALTILWPSGREQRLENLRSNRHIIIREGDNDVQAITPGQPIKVAKSTP